jgi:hypothetical protein
MSLPLSFSYFSIYHSLIALLFQPIVGGASDSVVKQFVKIDQEILRRREREREGGRVRGCT